MKKHYVLIYHYVADYMARRNAFRAEHLARIQQKVDEGFVLGAGVLPKEPAALILCYADSSAEVEDFAKNDPYYKAGLIASFEVDEWAAAAGLPELLHPAGRGH